MADLRTTEETVKTPIDGTELVRLATTGANWKATLNSIFAALGSAGTALPSAPTDSYQYNAGANTFGGSSKFTQSSGNPNVTAGNAYLYANANALIADPPNVNWHFAGAGNLTMTGTANLSMGGNALLQNTTGLQNLAFGTAAMFSNTTGGLNVAIGALALATAANAQRCLAIGPNAMINATGGLDNVGIGFQALAANTTGSTCVALGANALAANTIGISNNAVGAQALAQNTTGSSNSADGPAALFSNTIGSNNIGIGGSCLTSNIDGNGNLACGFQSLLSNVHGSLNVAYGEYSGFSATADLNVFVGYAAGWGVSTGNYNVFLGSSNYGNLQVTTGSYNISIGSIGQGEVPSATASNQLSIQNIIYGTNNTGTGATVSTGQIGIGIKAPTASLHLPATTTAQSQFRLHPGGTPTSPNDGDMWYDGTHLQFRLGGVTTQII